MNIAKRIFPPSRVYGLVKPGPVLLFSTAHKGAANVMPMSWHTMMEFEPPLVGCIVSGRDFSFASLRATGNVCSISRRWNWRRRCWAAAIAPAKVVDKFKAIGLAQAPAAWVDAPLIAECYANVECRVVETHLMNRCNLFVLEVLKAGIDPACKDPRTLHHRGRGAFMVAGETIKLPSKCSRHR